MGELSKTRNPKSAVPQTFLNPLSLSLVKGGEVIAATHTHYLPFPFGIEFLELSDSTGQRLSRDVSLYDTENKERKQKR